MDKDVALDQAFDYYTAIVNTDISRVDDVKRNPNLRSKTAIRTSDTRYFIDPSIATASLGMELGNMLTDGKTVFM